MIPESGGSLEMTTDIRAGYGGPEWVYAKSWGALPFYGKPEEEAAFRRGFDGFRVDSEKMALTDGAHFSHCLPLRRNVKATDEVMDADYCVAVEEAENRLHVQKVLMVGLRSAEYEFDVSDGS